MLVFVFVCVCVFVFVIPPSLPPMRANEPNPGFAEGSSLPQSQSHMSQIQDSCHPQPNGNETCTTSMICDLGAAVSVICFSKPVTSFIFSTASSGELMGSFVSPPGRIGCHHQVLSSLSIVSIHSKSVKMGEVCFFAYKNWRKKYVNHEKKIMTKVRKSRQKIIKI